MGDLVGDVGAGTAAGWAAAAKELNAGSSSPTMIVFVIDFIAIPP
jgi:hypothetical protein